MKQTKEVCRLTTPPISCHGCRYCQPCRNGVLMPKIFELFNRAKLYNEIEKARSLYVRDTVLRKDQRADLCIECGDCEKVCPQKIHIVEWLKRVHSELSGSSPVHN